jgi:cytochrome c-type biogenesis protein CcmF
VNPGLIGTWVAFATALVAGGLYLAVGTGRERLRPWADGTFRLQLVLLVGLGAWLWVLFLTHQFQYSYVASYSSRDMAPQYVFASFWGGQQGTFLLWAIYGAALGVLLSRSRNRLVPTAMFFLNWVQVFLLLILVVAGPFRILERVPPDGQGLNPLLQDFWMTIHPPVLFLGFASLAIPFALALSALCHRDRPAWLAAAPPWTLLSIVVLGTGFTLGGIWAYKVLGWGGFWGWDPVENTSLVPWLFAAALFHGLLVERSSGALSRTNLFLALLPFLFVLYGSFLTRSGVLADFSVHSFVDLGLNAYLLVFLGAFAAGGFGIWLARSGGMREPGAEIGSVSREFGLWLGMLTLLLMGLLTMLGTSAPLVSRLFGPPSAVQISYYNTVNGVLGLLLLGLAGLTPLVRWREDRWDRIGRVALVPLAGALVAVIAGMLLGVEKRLELLLLGGIGFALTANFSIVVRALRRGPTYAAGYVSHIGVTVLLIGIIALGRYGEAVPTELELGRPKSAFGFEFTYQGLRPQPDGKTRAVVRVRGAGCEFEALPVIYYSEFNRGMMRHPHVERFVTRDLYLSPVEVLEADRNAPPVSFAKGESRAVGDAEITFVDFAMQRGADEVRAEAEVIVERGGRRHVLEPAVVVNRYGRTVEAAEAPDGFSVSLAAVDATNGRVMLAVRTPGEPATPEALSVEISTKPLINLVWAGMGTLLLGSLLAVFRRGRPPRPRSQAA